MKISLLFTNIVLFFALGMRNHAYADKVDTIYKKTANLTLDEPTVSIAEYTNENTVTFRVTISDHCGLEYGTVSFHYKTDSKEGHIQSLHIKPQYRKNSYGSMLLNFALQTLTECKCTVVSWLASPFNLNEGENRENMLPKLITFYQRHGGIVVRQDEWCANLVYYPKNT